MCCLFLCRCSDMQIEAHRRGGPLRRCSSCWPALPWSRARSSAWDVLAASQQSAADSHPATPGAAQGSHNQSTCHMWWAGAWVPADSVRVTGRLAWTPSTIPQQPSMLAGSACPPVWMLPCSVLGVGFSDVWRCRSPGLMKPPHCCEQGEGAGLWRLCVGKARAS